ncbi:MAG: flagellar basal body L-ring protein FlgH [Alphaproteobacteria bacterium]|nr:flagellar basal body L-ring protein FlgH [Alphaproteobacteria bacterium]
MRISVLRLGLVIAVAANLAACSAFERLDHIGEAPPLSPIGGGAHTADRSVSLPMPQQEPDIYQANSLWAAGSRSFFKDQRASKVGDIVTVLISIDEKAELSNETDRSRKSNETADVSNLLGFEQEAGRLLPGGYDPTKAVGLGSDSSTQGAGSVNRKEKIDLTVAAVVTQVLPNGNLVIQGRQEVRVNFEVRDLMVSGIVRPEDISATNEVKHSQIAEARISYGGRGQITDVQQPRYGQQAVDILFPF